MWQRELVGKMGSSGQIEFQGDASVLQQDRGLRATRGYMGAHVFLLASSASLINVGRTAHETSIRVAIYELLMISRLRVQKGQERKSALD